MPENCSRTFCLIAALLLIPVLALPAKDVNYSSENGLPTNLTKAVTQDSIGFIWIGTDAGLVRFDGYDFKTFTEGLPTPYVKNLYKLRDGSILVATDHGIRRLISKIDTVYFLPILSEDGESIDRALSYPKSIYEDVNGNLWFGDYDTIVRFDGKDVSSYRFSSTYEADSYIRSFHFFEDRSGHLYATSQRGYLFQFDEKTERFQLIELHDQGRRFTIDAIHLFEDNTLWLGGDLGLYEVDLNADLDDLRVRKVSDIRRIQAIGQSDDGELYIGSGGDGLFTLTRTGADYEAHQMPGHTHEVISYIFFARDRSTWVCTDAGLTLIYQSLFSQQLPYANYAIQTMTETPGDIVYTTDGNSVYRIDKDVTVYRTTRVYTRDEVLISSIASDGENLWLGHIDGTLTRVNSHGTQKITLDHDGTVYNLMVDNEKNLWVSQYNLEGVVKISPDLKVWTYDRSDGLSAQIQIIQQSSDGHLYAGGLGSDGYLYEYDAAADSFVNRSIPLVQEEENTLGVYDMTFDGQGNVLLASNEGVLRHNGSELEVLFDSEHEMVKSVAMKDGVIWFSTDRGFYDYNKGEISKYTKRDGFFSMTFPYRSVLFNCEGRLWIGAYDGVYYLNVYQLGNIKTPVPTLIECTMNDKKVNFFEDNQGFEHNSFMEAAYASLNYPTNKILYQTRLLGMTDAWSEPVNDHQIIFPKIPQGQYTLQIRAQQTGYLWSDIRDYRFRIATPVYKSFWAYVFYLLIVGLITFILIIIHTEKTKRKRVESELKLTAQQLKTVVSRIPVFLFAFQEDGTILHAEGMGLRLLEDHCSLIAGDNILDVFGDDAIIVEKINAALSGEAYTDTIVSIGESYFELWFVPVFERGNVTGVVGIGNDITGVKLAEESQKMAKEAAENANKLKSEFLANMSHEIRTPMNGIIGMTDLTLSTDLSSVQREYLNNVKMSSYSLLAIVNDILDFSKIEAGKLELENIVFDVQMSVEDALKTISVNAHEKSLELTYFIAPDVPERLKGDPIRFKQIILNLLGNAIKFTSQGEVTLHIGKISENDKWTELRVAISDTGIGIPEDKLGSIFNAFTQSDGSTTRKFGGTGLGLTISTQLVEKMGGRIWAESPASLWGHQSRSESDASEPASDKTEPGVLKTPGSTFYFTVKLEKVPEQQNEFSDHKRSVFDPCKVLIVDDNRTNRMQFKTMIESWGIDAVSAADGMTGLKVLQDASHEAMPFNLLLCDVQMPGMNGFSLVEQLRLQSDAYDLKIILLTCSGRISDTESMNKLGISHWLSKPVRQSDLFEAMIELLPNTYKNGIEISGPVDESVDIPIRSVLLCEDNILNQKLATTVLELNGQDVTVVSNGRDAIEAYTKHRFDLILMDIQMPDMDGMETTQAIREIERSTGMKTPIIALTANAMKGDRERYLAAGMDGYISKPIDVEQLFRTIQKVLVKHQ